MIDTTKVEERRSLRFDSIEDCLAEVQKIADADRNGSLVTRGNWTAGQNLSHLAAWIEYGWEGYPLDELPLPIRTGMRSMLPEILDKGMEPGMQIPDIPGGTVGADEMKTKEAIERFSAALNRLNSDEPSKHDSPAFGKMSHAERVQLNLRHSELHLSFLSY